MDSAVLLEEIKGANNEIAKAADALQTLLGDLEAAPRTQKVTVSEVVREAFERLRRAKARLVELQKLLIASCG